MHIGLPDYGIRLKVWNIATRAIVCMVIHITREAAMVVYCTYASRGVVDVYFQILLLDFNPQ